MLSGEPYYNEKPEFSNIGGKKCNSVALSLDKLPLMTF